MLADQLRPIAQVRATPLYAFACAYLVMSLLAMAPSVLYFPYDVVRHLMHFMPTGILAGVLAAAVMTRYEWALPNGRDGYTYLLLSVNMLLVVGALVASIFAIIAGANGMLAIVRCTSRTEQTLGEYLYNATNITADTNYTLLMRRPYVHSVLGASQACIDDYPATVTFVFYAFATAVIDVGLALYIYLLRA